jgi:hypothetical protein
MDVGEVKLHLEHALEGVVDSAGIVGPGTWIDNDPMTLPCFADETDHLSLAVRLPELELYLSEALAQILLYIAEGQGTVDLWSLHLPALDPRPPYDMAVHRVPTFTL